MNWSISDISYFLSWYIVLPSILAYIILPFITFLYFCKYSRCSFQWYQGILYIVLSIGLYGIKLWFQIPGSLCLTAEILLLAGSGVIFLKRKWTESLMISVLILSLLNVCNGLMGWLSHRLLFPMVFEHEILIMPSDAVRELCRILFVLCSFTIILSRFGPSLMETNWQTLFQLTIPVFFISLVERIIQEAFYGDVIEVDHYTHEILPVVAVDHIELLFLQIFACICLVMMLFAYEKIIKILHAEQKVQLLERQAAEQEIYIQEAMMRYKQTRSFRHDIKNHLTVLAELLKTDQKDKACEYLSNLEQVSVGLSYPVNTGNIAVDVLLGSKLSIAEQKKIRICCELTIPGDNDMKDMDWCIILSNALDNAMKACEDVSEEERYIHIKSKKKGNFYLLVIENSCDKEIKKIPKDGTGLCNIRTVMEQHNGTMENTILNGNYKVKLLFGSLQH